MLVSSADNLLQTVSNFGSRLGPTKPQSWSGSKLLDSDALYSYNNFRKKQTNTGSYMSARVLLNLLNELRKRDKMWGLQSILLLFRNDKFNNTGAWMLYSIYDDIKITVQSFKSHFWVKTLGFCHIYVTLLKASFHNVSRKSVNH